MGRRKWIPSDFGVGQHPLLEGLINFFAPFNPVHGRTRVHATTRGVHKVTAWGRGMTGPGNNINSACIQANLSNRPAAYRPLTLFAAVHLDTNSEHGSFVGLNSAANADDGVHLCVGATAGDANGNNLVGLHGGVGWTTSGVAIGVGSHTVAMTDDATAGFVFYVDGRQVATVAAATAGTIGSTPVALSLAQVTSSISNTISCTTGVSIAAAALWSRVLPANSIAMLHHDPFCMMR